MTIANRSLFIGLIGGLALSMSSSTFAQSNIDPTDKFSWSENAGWINWRDANGSADGVIVQANFLSGFAWGENVGWLNLGDGTPSSGLAYANVDGSDFGVNMAADGALSGFAWGENIGWVNFGTSSLGSDQARFDFLAARFRGYAWGENVGWINLDDATHFVGLVDGPFPDECFLITETISEGTWPLDTTLATTGIDPSPVATCGGTDLGEFAQDIWFEYVPTESAAVEISTCGAGFDTDLAVYQGDCGSLTPVACSGDACQTMAGTPFASRLELDVVAGESYLIRVGGWEEGEFGTADLVIAALGTPYIRGDCNVDGDVNIGDAVTALSVLFSGASTTCTDACNTNADGGFDIADPIFALAFLFSAGTTPSAPFPDCGVEEQLGCDAFSACP